MRFADKVIQDGQITVQLAQIRGFEGPSFQFHGHERIELPVEEQQVDLESMAFDLDGILILVKDGLYDWISIS